jgi:histidyl-tRNA synthetase
MKDSPLSTQPYKGTRDFFPEDMQLRSALFNRLRQVVSTYGYQEYDGPMLEPFELYASKTSDEIVNEQLYSFTDRGDRKVAMRPEMTPTLARMVAAKANNLPRPIRWFSIPNLWRYERPQKGRLREHWQLNVDILGPAAQDAELELLQVAIDLLRAFGANETHFEIQINHRELTNSLFNEVLQLNPEQRQAVARAIDKRDKITPEAFRELLVKAACHDEQIATIERFLQADLNEVANICPESSGLLKLQTLFELLTALGLSAYCSFSPTIMRGFDYYTGTVFEIYDRAPENRRALFGGGRYDNLVGMFGGEKIPGIGFGMGDVTLRDFLETHGLLPTLPPASQVLVGLFNADLKIPAYQLARDLRAAGLRVENILEPTKKMGKQFEVADKKGIPIVVMMGPDEHAEGCATVKHLASGHQEKAALGDLPALIQQLLA